MKLVACWVGASTDQLLRLSLWFTQQGRATLQCCIARPVVQGLCHVGLSRATNHWLLCRTILGEHVSVKAVVGQHNLLRCIPR